MDTDRFHAALIDSNRNEHSLPNWDESGDGRGEKRR